MAKSLSLRDLLDLDKSNFNVDRPDNIRHNQILTAYSKTSRPKTFVFKYLTDLLVAGTNVTLVQNSDGTLTINSSGGGGTGTVTSVDVAVDGDAITPTGGPVTTAGTITLGFNGAPTDYIDGEGNLVAFPTLPTGTVESVTGESVDNTDPANPVVNAWPLAGTGTDLVTGTIGVDPSFNDVIIFQDNGAGNTAGISIGIGEFISIEVNNSTENASLIVDAATTRSVEITYDNGTNIANYLAGVNQGSDAGTYLRFNTINNKRIQFEGTAAPTVNDDSSLQYDVDSFWIYNGALYICTDASIGAAVWVEITGGGGVTAVNAGYNVDITGTTSPTVNSGIVRVNEVGHGFTVGQTLRPRTGSAGFAKTFPTANSSTVGDSVCIGYVVEVVDADNYVALISSGLVTTGVPVAAAGTRFYLDPTTPGGITSTIPADGNLLSPVLFIVQSGAMAVFNPQSNPYLRQGFKQVASASTVDILSLVPFFVEITGTTTINTFTQASTGYDHVRCIQFDGVLQLTQNTGVTGSLILPTGANITTQAGDCAIFAYNEVEARWICISYLRKDGTALAGGSGGTPAGSNKEVQFNNAGAFGAEAGFEYDSATNTLDVDIVTVNDEAYGSGWDASLEVPTKNAIYDKIESLARATTQLDVHSDISANFTYTNQPNSEQNIAQGNQYRGVLRFDATTYTEIRLVISISVLSASANDPRAYPQYNNGGGWTTIGAGTVASGDAVSFAATGAGKFSNWITLPAGALGDVWFRVAANGGDGAADPVFGNISLQIR